MSMCCLDIEPVISFEYLLRFSSIPVCNLHMHFPHLLELHDNPLCPYINPTSGTPPTFTLLSDLYPSEVDYAFISTDISSKIYSFRLSHYSERVLELISHAHNSPQTNTFWRISSVENGMLYIDLKGLKRQCSEGICNVRARGQLRGQNYLEETEIVGIFRPK